MKALAVSDRVSTPVIVVIGMMGSGKTTVAREVAHQLGIEAIDSDELIADRAGMSAAEQIRADEPLFRKYEAEVILTRLASIEPAVFSLGGGAPATPTVLERLKVHHPVVWLRVPVGELVRRIENHENDRPLLDGNMHERLTTLLSERTPIYEAAASVIIDAVGDPTEVAQRIVEALR